MGASFTNYQVRSQSAAAVKKALAKLVESHAYVSPAKNGWVTVYEQASDSQDQAILLRLASGLSQSLDTSVLGFLVHDSDLAIYWLYKGGVLIDEFNSAPDWGGEEVDDATRARVRGRTEALLPLCPAGTTRAQIAAVIHPPDEPPLFAENILRELAPLLGIDEDRIALGFEYFDQEGEELLPDAAEFTPVGKAAKRKKSKATPPAPAEPPSTNTPVLDMLPLAVGMLTKSWTDEPEKIMEAHVKAFPHMYSGTASQDMAKKLRSGFDRGARDFLKQSQLPNCPTIEELKTARDQGPKALAELLAKRAPTQLGSIAIDALNEGHEAFVSALLASGLDPHAKDHHGQTVLEVAEKKGTDSNIYKMLKATAAWRENAIPPTLTHEN